MLAWRSHIDGAVNIIKARGREKMCQTGLGTLLFIAVRYHLVRQPLPNPPGRSCRLKTKQATRLH